MSMEYIRRYYWVPAKRGGRVRLGLAFGSVFGGRTGTIVSADGQYLRVRVDTPVDHKPLRLHPTWELTYLEGGGSDGC